MAFSCFLGFVRQVHLSDVGQFDSLYVEALKAVRSFTPATHNGRIVQITANPNRPHYALLREGSHTSFVKKDLASAYNVRSLEYGPNHTDLVTDLQELQAQIDSIRAMS